MEQKILVLGFMGYSFNDDTTNTLKEGGKVQYLVNNRVNTDTKQGCLPLSCKVSFDLGLNLNQGDYPFVATAIMNLEPDSKGNAITTITSFKDIVSFDLQRVFGKN